MYYYAIINEEYSVMEVVSSSTVINDAYYIEITEEQYNDEGFLGYFYDQDKKEFVGAVMWMGTTNEIRYNETYRTLTGKLNEMDEEIATHTHEGQISPDELQALEDTINAKADANHTHSDYVSQVSFDELSEVVNGKANSSHTHSNYVSTSTFNAFVNEVTTVANAKADLTHTHDEYALSDDLTALEDIVDTKADADHSHANYATANHSHEGYALQTSLDTLGEEINEKADVGHIHTEYSLATHAHDAYAENSHNHDSSYAPLSHSHDNYVTTTDFDALEAEVDSKASSTHTHTASEIGAATSEHNHDSEYSLVGHDHDEDYAPIGHSHTNYATVSSVNELSTTVSGKANVSHSHDDVYYTETEIDTKLATKAESSHNHTGVYDVSGAAASALTSANAYTDSKIDALVGEGASTTLDTIGEIATAIEDNQDMIDTLNSAIGNKANASDLTSHTGNTVIHVTEADKESWNAKSNFSGNYNDLTNKPTIPSINGLATEIYVDEKVATVTVESIGAMPNTTVIPTIPTNISSFTNDVGYLTEHQSLDGLATETYVNTQIDAIVIPDSLSDLTADSTHRTVTDAEKTTWNAKSNFSGSYNDLTDKPSIPSISGLATETYVDEAVSGKADAGHNHNNVYYTETEIDTLLSNKSNSNHNHNSSYDVLGTAQTKANEVQANLDEAIDEFNAHAENADIHFTVAERNKLSGIAANANNYTHPNSGVTAGTYKSVTVNAQGHITAGSNPTTLSGYGITDAYTKTEVDTIASGKADTHTHPYLSTSTKYAGSSSAGGAATSANKLNTNAGDANTPVYFANGVPVACTSLDLNTTGNAATATNVAWSGVTSKPSYYDAKAIKSITRNGTTFTYTCMDGTTGTFTQQDNNTTYGTVTTSANGLMIASDKVKLDGMVFATVSEVETYLGI